MKTRIITIIAILIAGSVAADVAPTWRFERDNLVEIDDSGGLAYPDMDQFTIGEKLSIPSIRVYLPIDQTADLREISYTVSEPVETGQGWSIARFADGITSDHTQIDWQLIDSTYADRRGVIAVEVIGQVTRGDQRYAELIVSPVTVDSSGRALWHDEITLTLHGEPVNSTALVSAADVKDLAGARASSSASLSGSPEYLIITTGSLRSSLAALVQHKNEQGIATSLALIEDILPLYPGVDDAERLRNYLKDFYAAGGRYVLLAGDETVIPIRYAYHYSADEHPDLAMQQVCDLYFADLTGDWDTDGDGLYGERYVDAADLTPELIVGRIPVDQLSEATNYVDNLIRYETDPGLGDLSYLTRSFYFSSDQMRDYGEVGQHHEIAQAFPAWFTLDSANAVEASSGSDPDPFNAVPSDLGPVVRPGFGIINIIAHGRSDGFVVRSAGYNEWPKYYMLTTPTESAGHGAFDSLASPEYPSFYYSLACNNGAIDMDQPPFENDEPIVVEHLIGHSNAVGMVAYSRWGWISSSHLLQRAYFDSVFTHPEWTAAEAFYASKENFGYLRDLVYGINYYGDPTLHLHTVTPKHPELSLSAGLDGLTVSATVDATPVANQVIGLSCDGQLIDRFTTDIQGRATFDLALDPIKTYQLTLGGPGLLVGNIRFVPSLITDVEDEDDGLLPYRFALRQNYPNPFNPNTSIEFDLPTAQLVRLYIYNVLGQTVQTLVDRSMSAGTHQVEWHGQSEAGDELASGIYFYRLVTDEYSAVKKMILLR